MTAYFARSSISIKFSMSLIFLIKRKKQLIIAKTITKTRAIMSQINTIYILKNRIKDRSRHYGFNFFILDSINYIYDLDTIRFNRLRLCGKNCSQTYKQHTNKFPHKNHIVVKINKGITSPQKSNTTSFLLYLP